ncbi:MAG: amino acid permease, partial [Bacteroidia bacterium]|nr:amino acid permease [Bacteroidia bacterium]
MIMAGPRIIKSMGEDLEILNVLSRTNKNNVPYVAVIVQSAITVILILSARFEQVLTFVGFSLSIFTFLTVFSVFILRARKLNSPAYKTWGYPVTPLIFLALNAFILYTVFREKPTESLLGLMNVGFGGLIYLSGKLIIHKKEKQKCQEV